VIFYLVLIKTIKMIEELVTTEGQYPLNDYGVNENNFDSPTCWGHLKDDEFSPSYTTLPKVPAGVYEFTWNSQLQTHTLKKQPFKTDELYELPSEELVDILNDIESFWNRIDKYKEYNFIHKRGILLYGEPGCGKSGIIQLLSKSIINKDGVVINIKDEDDVSYFTTFIPTFRKIEPNRPIVVILEDIDSIAGESRHQTSKLLNILDGIKQIENVVYIATTNYPEKLEERITNRPSRFDRRFRIESPNNKIRENYIRRKLTEDDLSKINIDEWVQKTEKMSLSHLKELIISTIVMGRSFDDTIKNLKGLKVKPTGRANSDIGFGKG
jgi:hypothetical protein